MIVSLQQLIFPFWHEHINCICTSENVEPQKWISILVPTFDKACELYSLLSVSVFLVLIKM